MNQHHTKLIFVAFMNFMVLVRPALAADQVHVSFDPPLEPGGAPFIHEWIENDLYFTGPQGFAQIDSGKDRSPDNGSAYLRFANNRTLDFRFIDSTPFKLISIDLAEYSTLFIEPRTVTIVGHKTNGATVRRNVILDGIMDGPGPLVEFETFTFEEEFSNLSHVEIPSTRYTMDNVVVAPGTGAATLIGLEVTGPEQVFEGDLVPYEVIVTYGNGFQLNVTTTAELSVQPEDHGSIDENGILSTMNVDEPQFITLYAQYTEDAIHVNTEVTVQVLPSRTFYVPSDYNTIQAAINDANNGYVIMVEDGIYSGPGNRDIDFLGKAITVRSQNGPKTCIIDCNGSESEPHRGFFFHCGEDEHAIIDGLTIMNGYAPPVEYHFDSRTYRYWEGGAIFCYGSSPTIVNCRLMNNSADLYGGAISGLESNAVIARCLIENNMADLGGGISCAVGTMTISHCMFKRNKATWGGAVHCDSARKSTITNCLIIGNRAFVGGGLSTRGWSCEPVIRNCTVSGNTSTQGAAIFCGESSHPSIVNSILWGNDADNDAEITMTLFDWGSSLSIRYSDVRGANEGFVGVALGAGVIDSDPCFVDPGHWDANGTPNDPNDDIWIDGDYHLKSQAVNWDPNSKTWIRDDVTSLCIDAGDPNSDWSMEPFPNGERINVGAYGGTVEASKPYFGDSPSEGDYAPGEVLVRFAPHPDGSRLSRQEKKQLLDSSCCGKNNWIS